MALSEGADNVRLEHSIRTQFPGCDAQLSRFMRQYFQRVDLKHLEFPSRQLLASYEVQQWIRNFVNEAQASCPNAEHDRAFLKRLQLKIEDAVQDSEEPDVVDSFADLYAQLISHPQYSKHRAQHGYCWIRYTMPWSEPSMSLSDNTIDILEKPNVLADGGCTGHRTWEAALRFASVVTCPEIFKHVRNRRILELGSGTGLLSLLCAKLGASHVVATDGDSGAVERIKQSHARNFGVSRELELYGVPTSEHKVLQPSLCAHVFEWGSNMQASSNECSSAANTFDTVLAADVTYERSSQPDLVHSLKELLLLNPSTFILIGATARNENTLLQFNKLCSDSGLSVRELEPELSVPDAQNQSGFFHFPTAIILFYHISLATD